MTTLDLRSGGVDIRGHVGDDLTITATIVDSGGSAVDVSGYTISADVLRDGTSIASFSDSVGGAGSNVVTLSLTDTQTSTIGIEAGLRWSLSMTTGGTTRQYVGGAFRLSKAGDPNASSATSVTVTTEGAAISVTVAAGGGGGTSDHGALTGLADDDHTQYALADGSRGSFLTAAGSATVTNKTLQSFTNTIDADALHVEARNVSGVTITKGSVVYPTGYNVGADIVEVGLADSSAASTMPAIGVAEEDISNNSNGSVVVRGRIEGVDTSAYSVGDVLYVSETAGAMTATAPTGAAVVQVVATVLRSNVATGVIDVEPALGPTTSGFIATLLDDASASAARTTLGAASATTVPLDSEVDSFTLALDQAGTIVEVDKATAVVVTVPPQSSVAWEAGTIIGIRQVGAGGVSLSAGAGVTIRNVSASLGEQWSEMSLHRRAENDWIALSSYDPDALKADTADTLTAGFDATDYAAGTKSSGTYTPNPANGNFQIATNGGAHTLAPPSTSCAIVIHYTNNGSAGTITTSGFTVVDGDSFTTTDTHEFLCYITKVNDVSHLNVVALQ